jgi:RNA polymerase sigma factor (sigma-70 family)
MRQGDPHPAAAVRTRISHAVPIGNQPAQKAPRTERLDARSPSLLDAYLARQEELRRFFHARLGQAGEIDDLMQDLYLKVAAAPAGDEIRSPGAYLYRLASNVMLDRLRQRRRAVTRDSDWRRLYHITTPLEDAADLPSAESAAVARQHLRRVVEALDALPPMTRRIFRLHKFDGLSHAETAAEVGISRSSVEKHMMEALRHLAAKVGR